ncbi:MAG: PAS domain-containing protein [bacterium]
MDEFLMKNIGLDYRKIFNLINEEVVVIDNNYKIVDVNNVFLKQMGYSKKEVK